MQTPATICKNCQFYSHTPGGNSQREPEFHGCKIPKGQDFVTGIANYTVVDCYKKNTNGNCPDYKQIDSDWHNR